MGPISWSVSNEQQEVVPSVAETKNGTKPFCLSSSIARLSESPLSEKFSSVSKILNLTKAIIAAFSTHECAWLSNC